MRLIEEDFGDGGVIGYKKQSRQNVSLNNMLMDLLCSISLRRIPCGPPAYSWIVRIIKFNQLGYTWPFSTRRACGWLGAFGHNTCGFDSKEVINRRRYKDTYKD